MMKKQYTFVELMTNAPTGKVYEVIQPQANLAEKRVYLQETQGLKGRVLKRIKADGSHKESNGDTVLQLYGGYTAPTTRYRIIDAYDTITVQEALTYISRGVAVYVKDKWGDYDAVTKFTDLEDLEIRDFDDLLYRTFYKESEGCPFGDTCAF